MCVKNCFVFPLIVKLCLYVGVYFYVSKNRLICLPTVAEDKFTSAINSFHDCKIIWRCYCMCLLLSSTCRHNGSCVITFVLVDRFSWNFNTNIPGTKKYNLVLLIFSLICLWNFPACVFKQISLSSYNFQDKKG